MRLDVNLLKKFIEQIAKERDIPQNMVIETIESALGTAYKKEYGKKDQKIVAKIDQKTGNVSFWQIKKVLSKDMIYTEKELEKLKKAKNKKEKEEKDKKKIRFNPERHILIDEAKKMEKNVKVNDEIKIKLKPEEDFGRIAAQVAKQVILQKLKESERDVAFKEYKDKEGKLVSGIIQRVEKDAVFVDIGKTIGILPKSEQVKGEFYRPGQRMKFFVTKVQQSTKGPVVYLSRAHPKLITQLFELEVPEIKAGSVKIVSIAREPGFRTKVAVKSLQEGVDPIGSLVGQRGTRIMAVITELGGEKIDVIQYSDNPEQYIKNSLSPANVLDVKIGSKNTALCIVPSDQLSLAIGKEGRNVRLAAKLTNWRIDIKSPEKEEIYSSEDFEKKADKEKELEKEKNNKEEKKDKKEIEEKATSKTTSKNLKNKT